MEVRVKNMAGSVEVGRTEGGEPVLWLRSGMIPTQVVCELGIALEHYVEEP